MVLPVEISQRTMKGAVLSPAFEPLLMRALVGFPELVVIARVGAVTAVAIVVVIVCERRGERRTRRKRRSCQDSLIHGRHLHLGCKTLLASTASLVGVSSTPDWLRNGTAL
jgi:hypothetical protein